MVFPYSLARPRTLHSAESTLSTLSDQTLDKKWQPILRLPSKYRCVRLFRSLVRAIAEASAKYIFVERKFEVHVTSRVRGSVGKWHKCVSSSFRTFGFRPFILRQFHRQISTSLDFQLWSIEKLLKSPSLALFLWNSQATADGCGRTHTRNLIEGNLVEKKETLCRVCALFSLSVCSLLFYCFLAPSPSLSLSICLFVYIVYLYIHIFVFVHLRYICTCLTSFYIRFVCRLCTCVCVCVCVSLIIRFPCVRSLTSFQAWAPFPVEISRSKSASCRRMNKRTNRMDRNLLLIASTLFCACVPRDACMPLHSLHACCLTS